MTPQETASGHPDPRLTQAAHEFEARMMKELIKPLSGSDYSDEADSDSGSGGALADFAAETLGQSLSRVGGLGIASSILHSLSRLETASEPSSRSERVDGKMSMQPTDRFKETASLPISSLRSVAYGSPK